MKTRWRNKLKAEGFSRKQIKGFGEADRYLQKEFYASGGKIYKHQAPWLWIKEDSQ